MRHIVGRDEIEVNDASSESRSSYSQDGSYYLAPCPVPDCPERGKPHEQIISRNTLYQMFDPDGSYQIFFCNACGNIFAPTPAEKERIQRSLANGTV